jgi:hypothetical protein
MVISFVCWPAALTVAGRHLAGLAGRYPAAR